MTRTDYLSKISVNFPQDEGDFDPDGYAILLCQLQRSLYHLFQSHTFVNN